MIFDSKKAWNSDFRPQKICQSHLNSAVTTNNLTFPSVLEHVSAWEQDPSPGHLIREMFYSKVIFILSFPYTEPSLLAKILPYPDMRMFQLWIIDITFSLATKRSKRELSCCQVPSWTKRAFAEPLYDRNISFERL